MPDNGKPPTQFLKPALFDNTMSGVQGRGVTSNSARSRACHAEVRRRFFESGLSKAQFIDAHARGIGAGTKFSDGQGGSRAYSDETLDEILADVE